MNKSESAERGLIKVGREGSGEIHPLEYLVRIDDIASHGLHCLDPDDSVESAIKLLTEKGLDRAPVLAEPVTTHVTAEALRQGTGFVRDVATIITADQVVSGSARLAPLLGRFRDREFYYVLGERDIEGIVTRADLQSAPVSMAVLEIILSLERAMTPLIAIYSHDGWTDLLEEADPKRRKALQKRFRDWERENAELSELDCLDLVDRFVILNNLPELRQDLGLGSKKKTEKMKRRVVRVRNQLAHGGSVLSVRSDLQRTLDEIEEIRQVASRSWDVLEAGNFRWDAFAESEIELLGDVPLIVRGELEAESRVEALPFRHLFVLSAENPAGIRAGNAANARRTVDLQNVLVEEGLAYWPAKGRSREGKWCEESFAVVDADGAIALELSKRFGQKAFFEITADRLRVIETDSGRVRRERAAVFSEPESRNS